MKHLKGSSELRYLDIGVTGVGDAGLVHIGGVEPNSKMLNICGTKISDAGLQHLKGLTILQKLCLLSTKVGDARLEHLKGLPNSKSWTSRTPWLAMPGWYTSRR